jgi:hypothetical protein
LAVAANSVTVGTAKHDLTGTNIPRTANALVLYTAAFGKTTKTNEFGFEATIIDDKVVEISNSIGNATIPPNGAVLSGHGTSRTWLLANAKVGTSVILPGSNPAPEGTPLYPDITVRTLRQFIIDNPTTGALAGHKLLKFPGVTANTGDGPFEVIATRASTSSPWVARQTIFYSNGSKQTIPNSLNFYYAGDGHTHWHMLDFDAYNLYNEAGTKIKTGEKHGFCFEDNTSYRDWPGSPSHPASPAVGVYMHSNACGVMQPNALEITHGLSVGWSDTYPTTLPDQAIDITGRKDGTYKVEITADQGNWLKESNETNNSSWAMVTIKGNTVTMGATGGGS